MKEFIAAIFLSALLVLSPWILCGVGVFSVASAEDSPELIRKQIDYQKKEIQKIEKNISAKTKKMAEINMEKVSVLKEMNKLDNRLAEQWLRLEETRKQWSVVELALAETESRIAELREANEQEQKIVEQRLRVLREMGTLGVLNVLFSADSLIEMMSRETNLRLILDNDRALREDFVEKLNMLKAEEERLSKKSAELAELAVRMEQERKELQQTRRERKAFLDNLEKESERYAAMIDEMRDASKSLNAIVSKLSLEAERVEKARREAVQIEHARAMYDTVSGDAKGFAALRGRLITPAPGVIVIPYSTKGRLRAGILFACPWGSRIKAIYDGKVVLTKNLPGYGRIMIIDHGDNFMTLTGQAIQFFKNTGDSVYEGETIGMAGGGPWIEEGIYFEIRHGEYQENPLRWLDIRGVKVVQGR